MDAFWVAGSALPGPMHTGLTNRPLPRKKRLLDLVKCGRCRDDKVKCLPTNRQWPQKCERCAEKGLPCSEGTRAARKKAKRATAPGVSRHASEDRRPEQREQPQNLSHHPANVEERPQQLLALGVSNWVFLLTLHKMNTAALRELHNLKQRICDLFSFDTHSEQFHDKVIDTDVEKFEIVTTKLQSILSSMTGEIVRSNHHRTNPVIAFTLLAQFHSEQLDLAEDEECFLCNHDAPEPTMLDELRRLGDVGGELLVRYERLRIHAWAERVCRDLDVDAEWNRIDTLLEAVTAKAKAVLHDLCLSEQMPIASKERPLYLPQEAYVDCYVEGYQFLGRADCLGRTRLQQLLDCEGGTGWVGMMKLIRHADRMGIDLKLDEQDILGRSALHIACLEREAEMVDELRLEGADPRVTTVWGAKPLHFAAAAGSIDFCRMLLSHDDVEPNALDAFGNSALLYAVRNRHTELVRFILSHSNVDPDIGFYKGYYSGKPLREAIAQSNDRIVKHLLDHGADPYFTDVFGHERVALIRAVEFKNIKICMLLLEKAPDLIHPDEKIGYTPFLEAAKSGFVEGVCLLASLEANINHTNYEGRTAIMLASRTGQSEVVKILLEHADVRLDLADRWGKTAKTLAWECGHHDVVRLLEEKSAWFQRQIDGLIPSSIENLVAGN